jgi:hypothetical protein
MKTNYKDPLYYSFYLQRNNARLRGIVWDLEYEEWLKIWKRSKHLYERGKGIGQYVMARYNDKGPYRRGNVYICSAEVNAREGAHNRKQILIIRARRYKNLNKTKGLQV